MSLQRTDEEFVLCRGFQHAWEPCAVPRYASATSEHLFMACTRCGTEKTIDVDPSNGEAWATQYYRTPRYQEFLDQEGVPTPREAKVEMLRRQKRDRKKS